MFRKFAIVLLGAMMLVTQTFGMAAHCAAAGADYGHARDAASFEHVHDDSGDGSVHHGHMQHHGVGDTSDPDSAACECALGCAAPAVRASSEFVLEKMKAHYSSGLRGAMLGTTLSQPTPPPNATF